MDKVQKGRGADLTDDAVKKLRKKQLIEGRKPNYFISAKIAGITNQKAAYTRNKGFDKTYYLDLIENIRREHNPVTRHDVIFFVNYEEGKAVVSPKNIYLVGL